MTREQYEAAVSRHQVWAEKTVKEMGATTPAQRSDELLAKERAANKATYEAFKAANTYHGPTARMAGVPEPGREGSVVDRMNAIFDARIAAAPIEVRGAVRAEVELERAAWMANAAAVAQRHEDLRKKWAGS